jgi:tetratricopeptide (TPR) repeat protein
MPVELRQVENLPDAASPALACLALACVVAAPAAGWQGATAGGGPLREMGRAIEAAERSLAAGEPQVAESRYRTALYEGWLLLGSVAERAGDLEGAEAAFGRALVSVVENRSARIAQAMVQAKLGRPDEAEVLLRSLIAEDTADHESRRLLARMLADAGRVGAAVQELEQLHYLTPGNAENGYFLATAYLREGQVGKAQALLDELAETIPTPQTWVLIGRTYRDAELYERSRAAFGRALEMDPAVPRAHYYLGTIDLLDQGRALLDSAIEQFEAELELDAGDAMTHLYRGIALVETRRYEEAIRSLEIASALAAVRADANRFLGRSLLALGRTEEAIAALRRGLEAADGAPDSRSLSEFEARQISSLHYQLAQALRESGRAEEAEGHFEAAKRYHARSAESARESLDRYLASETAAATFEPTATSGAEDGSSATAAEVEALRASLSTSLARVYFNLGVLETRSQALEAAIGFFEEAERLDDDLPQLQYSLGAARFAAGLFDGAAPALEKALEAAPESADLRRMLALSWLNAGEPLRAADLLAGDPTRESSPQLQYAYGLALVRGGHGAEAEEIFKGLLAENGTWPELNVVLGQAHAQQGDYPRAVEFLERAIALDPTVGEAHSTLGEIHLRRGDLDLAEAALRAELRSHPEDERAAFGLATVLDLNQRPEEAAALLRSLLVRHPELAKGRYLLGKILLARGAAEDATEQLEAAAGLAPGDPMIHYQLGLAYRELGRPEASRHAFEMFRALKREEG